MTYDGYAANGFEALWLWPLTEPHNHNQATVSAVCAGPAVREDKNMSNDTGTSTRILRHTRALIGAVLAVAALTASVVSAAIDPPPSKEVVRYSATEPYPVPALVDSKADPGPALGVVRYTASDPVPTPALVNPQADPPPSKDIVRS